MRWRRTGSWGHAPWGGVASTQQLPFADAEGGREAGVSLSLCGGGEAARGSGNKKRRGRGGG
jgi:hypothetical protein